MGEQQVLAGFYKSYNLPEQKIHSTQEVLNRSLAVVGKTDWLAGQEKVSDSDCQRLAEWAEPNFNPRAALAKKSKSHSTFIAG